MLVTNTQGFTVVGLMMSASLTVLAAVSANEILLNHMKATNEILENEDTVKDYYYMVEQMQDDFSMAETIWKQGSSSENRDFSICYSYYKISTKAQSSRCIGYFIQSDLANPGRFQIMRLVSDDNKFSLKLYKGFSGVTWCIDGDSVQNGSAYCPDIEVPFTSKKRVLAKFTYMKKIRGKSVKVNIPIVLDIKDGAFDSQAQNVILAAKN